MALFNKNDLTDEKENQKYKKAAKLLLALGDEKASEVIKHLDEKTIRHVALEIAKIRRVKTDEKQDLLKTLDDQVKIEKQNTYGGVDTAFEYLTNLIGEDRAKEKMEKIQASAIKADFSIFEDYPLKDLITVLTKENSQMVAVFLSQINPGISAKILASFARDKRAEIAVRIAKMNQVNEAVLHTLKQSLVKKLDALEEEVDSFSGEEKLKTIMSYLDKKSEEQLLKELEKEDQQLYEKMKARDLIFENLQYLTAKEIRKIFENLGDNRLWAMALKGAGTKLVRHILGAVSVNRSGDIYNEIQYLKKVPLTDIKDARDAIMTELNILIKQGVISSLHEPDQKYI